MSIPQMLMSKNTFNSDVIENCCSVPPPEIVMHNAFNVIL